MTFEQWWITYTDAGSPGTTQEDLARMAYEAGKNEMIEAFNKMAIYLGAKAIS